MRKNIRISHWGFCCVVVVGLFLSGCGDSGPTPVDISGTVTFQGAPVENGKIFFADVNNSVATGTGNIKNGYYEAQIFPGEKRIRINASKKTGKILDVMGTKVEEEVEIIPLKYNANTTLVRTVEPDGVGVLDFSL